MHTYTHTHVHTYTYTYKLVYLSAEKGAVLYCFNFFNKSFLNDAFVTQPCTSIYVFQVFHLKAETYEASRVTAKC